MKTIKRATILCIFIARLTATPLLCEQPQPPAGSPAAAIEVDMIQAGEISLPAEFQVALYENLIQELPKKGGFSQVYRDGDRNAAGASNLVTLQTTGYRLQERQRTGARRNHRWRRDLHHHSL